MGASLSFPKASLALAAFQNQPGLDSDGLLSCILVVTHSCSQPDATGRAVPTRLYLFLCRLCFGSPCPCRCILLQRPRDQNAPWPADCRYLETETSKHSLHCSSPLQIDPCLVIASNRGGHMVGVCAARWNSRECTNIHDAEP